MTRFTIALFTTTALCTPAWAQNAVVQSGTVVAQEPAKWQGDRRAMRGGDLQGDNQGLGLAPHAITVPTDGGLGLCLNAGTTLTAGYKAACFGVRSTGSIYYSVNGTEYDLGDGTGDVTGPATTTLHNAAAWNDTTGTILSDEGAPGLLHVATNAALKALAGYAGKRVIRDGFLLAGDGGAAPYNWSTINCTAADDGKQVQPAATGCWIADFSGMKPTPKIWGAVGDGSATDTVPVQAAITAMSGQTLYTGPYLYKTAALTISSDGTTIIGPSARNCNYGFTANADNIPKFITISANNVSIEKSCVNHGFTSVSGIAIYLGKNNPNVNGTFLTTLRDTQINASADGVVLDGTHNAYVLENGFSINSANGRAIVVGPGTTAANTIDTVIQNNSGSCAVAGAGTYLAVLDSGGLTVRGNNFLNCNYGTRLIPGANQAITWTAFENTVLGDTDATAALDIDAALNSGIWNVRINGSWASNTTGGAPVRIRNSGAGVVDGIHFVGATVFPNAAGNRNGIDIAGTILNVTIDSSTICASSPSTGTGILVGNAVTGLAVRGNRIGGCDHGNITASFAKGIEIGTGTNDVTLTSNDFTTSTTPITWLPAGLEFANIRDNIGVDNLTPTVASTGSINIGFNPFVNISGVTGINTISPRWANRVVDIIPTGAWATTLAGNICSPIVTATVNTPLRAFWSAQNGCWYVK